MLPRVSWYTAEPSRRVRAGPAKPALLPGTLLTPLPYLTAPTQGREMSSRQQSGCWAGDGLWRQSGLEDAASRTLQARHEETGLLRGQLSTSPAPPLAPDTELLSDRLSSPQAKQRASFSVKK